MLASRLVVAYLGHTTCCQGNETHADRNNNVISYNRNNLSYAGIIYNDDVKMLTKYFAVEKMRVVGIDSTLTI